MGRRLLHDTDNAYRVKDKRNFRDKRNNPLGHSLFSLTPLTPLICSALSLARLAHSIHGVAYLFCTFPRGLVDIWEYVHAVNRFDRNISNCCCQSEHALPVKMSHCLNFCPCPPVVCLFVSRGHGTAVVPLSVHLSDVFFHQSFSRAVGNISFILLEQKSSFQIL